MHNLKQMLGKLLLVTQRELGLDMVGMMTKCMKTMHHIGNIVVMQSLSHSVAYHNKRKI